MEAFLASNPILAAESVDGKSSHTHNLPFETFLFFGGEVFSHTFTFAVKSFWAHGHQFPLHYIQRLKGPEFRNMSKRSGFYGGDFFHVNINIKNPTSFFSANPSFGRSIKVMFFLPGKLPKLDVHIISGLSLVVRDPCNGLL